MFHLQYFPQQDIFFVRDGELWLVLAGALVRVRAAHLVVVHTSV